MAIQVSIVIPTYNQRLDYLTEAIESALHQTYPREKYEIIVVDDGSRKTPPNPIISKYEKQGVKFILNPHGRTAHTLNTGIQKMQGKYFKWLSSDDVLCENTIEALVNRADENSIIYGDWVKINEKSVSLNVVKEPVFKSQKEMKRHLWRQFFGNGGAALIPRAAFKKVGLFDEKLPYIEDYDWWLRAAFLHNFAFNHIDRVVYKYRVHQNQISTQLNKRDQERLITRWLVKKRIYDMLDKNSQSEAVPAPTAALFFQQLFVSDITLIYQKVTGIGPNGRARTPTKIRKTIGKLVAL